MFNQVWFMHCPASYEDTLYETAMGGSYCNVHLRCL